ncbi:MAG: hypothetical protein O2931_15805, partial [Planctomycetota bacterium]|nr:hypothetical protein [Planctomycetota bacterium]
GTSLEQRRWQDGLATKRSLVPGESKSAPLLRQPPALVWFGFGFTRVMIAAIALWTIIYAMAVFALQSVRITRTRS